MLQRLLKPQDNFYKLKGLSPEKEGRSYPDRSLFLLNQFLVITKYPDSSG
jgi:hypothetical protein